MARLKSEMYKGRKIDFIKDLSPFGGIRVVGLVKENKFKVVGRTKQEAFDMIKKQL